MKGSVIMEKIIYLDNAATTMVRQEVVDAMLPYFTEQYGNPSSVYKFAGESKKAVDNARDIIAKSLNTNSQDIYFTAGGSESDNWALKATAEAYRSKGKHIITSKIEHHAILHTCDYLEKEGLVIREEHDGFPPLVQYSLTSLAKAFLLEISYVIEWGQLHFEEITSKRSYGKN